MDVNSKYPQMLTIQQIQDELNKITYKDGWFFEARQGAFEGHHLTITATLPDSVNLGQNVDLKIETPIPPYRSIEDFHLWLVYRLIRIESHEAREWLKVKGIPIFYPHMEGADADQLQTYFKGFE
jgi:hypothetical protein